MSQKPRSPGQTGISISLPDDLLGRIDRRAESLGLNRSQYLLQLARKDIEAGGAFILNESPVNPSSGVATSGIDGKAKEMLIKEYPRKRRRAAHPK